MGTAFDAQAARYDEVANSTLGLELRTRVHRVLDGLISPGDAVADLGCGTGIDAAWLAPQVRSVLALDASPEMVALAENRCAGFANVTVRCTDLAAGDDLGGATSGDSAPLDLALANFGVVNCVGDLHDFGQRLHASMTPGGYAVLVTMTKWCPTELMVGLATANRQLLTRRRPSANRGGDYAGLSLRYASAHELARLFGSGFELVHAESLGSALPPFEQRHWLEGRPQLARVLATTDRRIAGAAARFGIGDHQIAVLRRSS